MNKKGLSMISIVIYVVLFFAFSAFAVGMATNMNYRTLSQKGEIINAEGLQKLQYNLLSSAKDSSSIDIITDKIIFSNDDVYTYDENKKKVYKNDGIIASDVTSFKIITAEELQNVPESFIENLDKNIDYLCIEVTFSKYDKTLTEKIFVAVGDDFNV